MDLATLMSPDVTRAASLLAWSICLLWAAYVRRWRLTCAFGCLAAASVLRSTAAATSDKIIVVALAVFAVMLLMSDVRAHAKRRARDNPPT